MPLNKFFLKMFLMLGLTACSGFSPGGPGGAVGGGAGPNNLAPPGSGVPGTQQTDPGIGIPGGISFDVQVHVMENGRERRCDGSLAPLGSTAEPPSSNSMSKGLNQFNWDFGNSQPLDDPVGPAPQVTLTFVPDVGVAPGPQTKQALCTADKGWLANFFHGFACTEDRCSTFRVSAHATLPVDNRPDLTSRTFEGPPFPNRTGNEVPIPIHLTLTR